MRPPKDVKYWKFIRDAAPEQFSTSQDTIMIYKLYHDNDLIASTEDFSPKEMAKYCRDAAKFFEKVARFVERKKKIGKRCT